jgi:hypothetical protein
VTIGGNSATFKINGAALNFTGVMIRDNGAD